MPPPHAMPNRGAFRKWLDSWLPRMLLAWGIVKPKPLRLTLRGVDRDGGSVWCDDFQDWLEEDDMSVMLDLIKAATRRGHDMSEKRECPLPGCTCHWECTKCGGMVVMMHDVLEESPGARLECGHDLVIPPDRDPLPT